MGIEPTQDPSEPHTGFEDQGRHQAPVTSDKLIFSRVIDLIEARGYNQL